MRGPASSFSFCRRAAGECVEGEARELFSDEANDPETFWPAWGIRLGERPLRGREAEEGVRTKDTEAALGSAALINAESAAPTIAERAG